MNTEPLKVPKSGAGDAGIAMLRAATGSIPIVGAAATELFNWFVKPPLENRRDDWMRQVGEALEYLRTKRSIDLEALQKDEAFIDVVMQATHVAMRNHQAEKREALRNAITNSIGPNAPTESKRQMFLQFIDRFTVQHVAVLSLLADPNNWFYQHGRSPPQGYGGSAEHAINMAFPELNNEPALRDAIWNDAKQAGLASIDVQAGIVTVTPPRIWGNSNGKPGVGPYITTAPFPGKFTTSLGDEFLAFIKSPEA